MSHTGQAQAAEGFHAPGPVDFFLPDFTGSSWNEHSYHVLLTKASLLLVLGAVVAYLFLAITSRRSAAVPSKSQYFGEQAYDFVRNGIAQDIIGSKEYRRYVPLLVSLFFFVVVNNLFGILPLLTFSPFSRVSFAYGLAVLVWLVYNGVGVMHKGLGGYLKHATVPSGVPVWTAAADPAGVPVQHPHPADDALAAAVREHVRRPPADHPVLDRRRLPADRLHRRSVLKLAGVVAFVLGVAIGFLEIVVALLQAYVFTLLTAQYISGALASEH